MGSFSFPSFESVILGMGPQQGVTFESIVGHFQFSQIQIKLGARPTGPVLKKRASKTMIARAWPRASVLSLTFP